MFDSPVTNLNNLLIVLGIMGYHSQECSLRRKNWSQTVKGIIMEGCGMLQFYICSLALIKPCQFLKSFEAARMSILGYFLSDFSFKSRDWIQFNTFFAIGIDNSYCKERIFGSKLISEGYSVVNSTKLGNGNVYYRVTFCQFLKWQIVSDRMNAGHTSSFFWCDTPRRQTTIQTEERWG